MRTIRTASITLLVLAGFTAEADPWLTVAVPDGAKTAEHFNASVYGKVFNSPEFAPLKAKWAAAIDAGTGNMPHDAGDEFTVLLREAGVNPLDLFTRLRFLDAAIQGVVVGRDGKQVLPGFRVAFDLGAQFAQLAVKGMTKDLEKGTTTRIAVAGSDEAFLDADPKHPMPVRTLRFGEQFVVTNTERADWQKPVTPAPAAHDLVVRFLPAACAAFVDKAVAAADRVAVESLLERLRPMIGAIDVSMDLVPAGMASRMVIPEACTFSVPVDMAVLARLPANTLSAIATGVDGAAWWAKERPALFKTLGAAQKPPISAEQVEQNLDAALRGQGLACSAAELVSGIKGTGVFALMQAAPFPTAMLAIPRSKGLDEVVGLVLKQMAQEMPVEGGMAMIPLGMMPISLTLVRAPGHWLVTTDTMLASNWTGSTPGGWLDTPVGKIAVTKAGSDAWLVGAADNAAEIRMYTGFLAMGIQQVPGLTAEERQAVLKTMNVLARNAQPGWCTGRNKGTTAEWEITALTGGFAVPAIAAAIAIPALMKSHAVHEDVTAANNASAEAATVATLRSAIFPAEVQFQAGAYMDQDKDGIGEYGFFQELAGGPIAGQKADITVHLLKTEFNAPEPELNGYRYAIYLPDGQGGASAERLGVRQVEAKSATAQREHFVVYAWPSDNSHGHHVFALTPDGKVRSPAAAADGQAPTWNALFGGEGKGWQDAPVWPVYRR